jgi:protein TonB
VRFLTELLMAAILGFGPLSASPTPQGGSKTDSSPKTVRVGGDIKPPLKVKGVAPLYPTMAKQSRIQGVVILEATIGTDGKVKEVKVARSAKFFDDAAVSAVRNWEYKPTMVDGQAVQVIITIPVNFTLDN